MNKQSASTALEESPSSRAAASPHNELLMRFPLSGQLISISPDMRFQRTGIFNLTYNFSVKYFGSYVYFTAESHVNVAWGFCFLLFFECMDF